MSKFLDVFGKFFDKYASYEMPIGCSTCGEYIQVMSDNDYMRLLEDIDKFVEENKEKE